MRTMRIRISVKTTKEDERKAEYTDRPLTDEERIFAADLDNYNKFIKYMRLYRLDQEEWYDVLIIPYLQAVKKYFTISKLQEYDFGAILFRTLDSARKNYFRSINKQRQIDPSRICSLDWESKNTDQGVKMAPEWWIDYRQSVERSVLYKEMVMEVLNGLNDKQANIFMKLLEEYGKEEIRKDLGMNRTAFYKMISEIKQIVFDYLSI